MGDLLKMPNGEDDQTPRSGRFVRSSDSPATKLENIVRDATPGAELSFEYLADALGLSELDRNLQLDIIYGLKSQIEFACARDYGRILRNDRGFGYQVVEGSEMLEELKNRIVHTLKYLMKTRRLLGFVRIAELPERKRKGIQVIRATMLDARNVVRQKLSTALDVDIYDSDDE